MRIVHLSDIHLGSISVYDFNQIIEKTRNLQPDMVMITGDLLDHIHKDTSHEMQALLDFTCPVFMSSAHAIA